MSLQLNLGLIVLGSGHHVEGIAELHGIVLDVQDVRSYYSTQLLWKAANLI
jgi:hypothetical protein